MADQILAKHQEGGRNNENHHPSHYEFAKYFNVAGIHTFIFRLAGIFVKGGLNG